MDMDTTGRDSMIWVPEHAMYKDTMHERRHIKRVHACLRLTVYV